MASSTLKLPSAKTLISTAASLAATTVLIRSIAKDLIPHQLSHYFFNKLHGFFATFTNEITLIIREFDGFAKNHLFYAAEIYLSTIPSPSTKRFCASVPETENNIRVSVGGNEDLIDKFSGFQLKWRIVHQQTDSHTTRYHDERRSTVKVEVKFMELTFHKKHKNKVVNEYLPFILEKSKVEKQETKTLKLHTLKNDRVHHYPPQTPWQAVNLDHPATFATLAMDDELKEMIIDDLDLFVRRKSFYKRVGKAWKRGYLLFGPPGTGKSSLIAAMANYLKFDIYDLELTDLARNSDMRQLLLWTSNQSILVVEDIDASIDLSERKSRRRRRHGEPMYYDQPDQEPKVTLSGLLNFADGLWSSVGDERIIVFTTNHIEKLDPALLRPGRMDMHIHMSYCTRRGLQMLVSNYHGTQVLNHPLVSGAEELILETNVTPAEVAEQLLKNEDPEPALRGLVEFIEEKKKKKVLKAEAGDDETGKSEVGKGEDEEEEDDVETGSKLRTVMKMSEGLKNKEAVDALKVLVGILGGPNPNADG